MLEGTTATMINPVVEATTEIVMPMRAQAISSILLLGTIRGAILLFKDAMKKKGFAKIIRWIVGIIQLAQLLSILGSLIMIAMIYTKFFTTGIDFLAKAMLIIAGIGFISIITNIRGGILLFLESKKKKGFDKRIRIICGILMIIEIYISFLLGI